MYDLRTLKALNNKAIQKEYQIKNDIPKCKSLMELKKGEVLIVISK